MRARYYLVATEATAPWGIFYKYSSFRSRQCMPTFREIVRLSVSTTQVHRSFWTILPTFAVVLPRYMYRYNCKCEVSFAAIVRRK